MSGAVLSPALPTALRPPEALSKELNPLKVVQINTWDRVGGAARVAERLQIGLRRLGHQPRELAGYGTENGGVDCLISAWPGWKRLIRRGILSAEDWLGLQYLLIPWSGEFLNHPWVREADVVQLHNLHGGYISHTVLPQLSQQKPVVWTLHDMWPLTGHCAYSFECTRWQTGCGACPDLKTYPDIRVDRTGYLWRRKHAIYAKSQLTLVTPSRWLAGLVRQSEGLGRFPVHHIPNGIDLDRYRQVPKAHARATLGLPQEMPLILFIAEYLDEPRKGGRELAQALARLPRELTTRVGFMTVGRGAASLRLPEHMSRFDLGFIENDALLPEYFSAADVVVCPSLADNLPNTILEAMACGTPAVAFASGGIPEVVRHLETGYLAAPGAIEAFARGLQLLVEDGALRQRLAEQGARLAQEEYSVGLQVQRYVDLYRDVAARFQRDAGEIPAAVRTPAPAMPADAGPTAGRARAAGLPLTIFSMPKPFRGPIATIQRNAIRSWTLLRPACEVILLGDEFGTAEVARELGVRHLPQVAVNEYGTPRIDSIFEAAQRAGRHELQCYVNCDIILMGDFLRAVAQVAHAKRRFLMVGQRWNMDVQELLEFETQWEERLHARARHQGQLFVATGMDYFVFPRGLWGRIPPFAIGRTAWDNWLLYRARAVRAPLIDATRVVMAIHQNHDYAHHPEGARGVWQGVEAKRNLELAGGWPHMFMVKDATHVLLPAGLRLALDHWRLWRLVRTLPALYPNMPAPLRGLLAGVNWALEASRPLRVKLKLSETFEVPQ